MPSEKLRSHTKVGGVAEAHERTARSEERLNMALTLAEMHVWEMDFTRGELIKAGAEDTFYSEPKTFEELAADIYGSIDERDRQMVKDAWRAHIKEGAPYHPEYRTIRNDDKEVWASCGLKMIADDQGRALRLIGVLQNVTARKQAEQQLLAAKEEAEAANLAKSQFLANMSHEIRTPMNGVIGMNELLLRTALTPEQKTYAEAVRTSAEALMIVINDILDISKLEAGKVDLERIDFSLATIVEDVTELLSPRAGEKGLEMVVDIDDGARRTFKGDPTRIRQILLNLASNALKFTETGHVTVQATSQPAANDRTRLRIEVQDTGIGLSEAQKAKLFQNFQQADGSITRKYGGTGLGLSISRQFVELMGGAIGVTDRPGGGSTFWFELELDTGLPAACSVVIEELAGARILVVDDLALNRTIFRRQLEPMGAEVVEADSAAACLAAMAHAHREGTPFDLVLMDQQMPDVSGDMAAAEIRAHPDWRQPRIVMASSIGQPLERDAAQRAGLDTYLIKPVRRQALIACIAGLLAQTPDATEPAPCEADAQAGDGQTAHVLLAEDNEINTLLVKEILSQMGFTLECVSNGAQALEAAASRPFDLILMDVHMPVMDGLEATRRIRQLGGEAGGLPIIAMTADVMKSDRDACFAAGMTDFVSKPFRPDDFVAVLERLTSADPREGAEVQAA